MRNFGHLMQASTAPYVAFCDQDDLWDADKLSLSMQRMLLIEQEFSVEMPAIVFSDVRLIDMSGKLVILPCGTLRESGRRKRASGRCWLKTL